MPREWAEAEYSRIYWTVVDDLKFEHVFDDDRRWAAYTRLLMAAEATYPSPAALPRWLADDVMEFLAEARIIDVVRGSSYRIVGLKAEREGRLVGNRVGGKARVAGAQRDEHGRFLAGETLDIAGNAGSSLDMNAGPASLESSEPARRGRDEDETRGTPKSPPSGDHGNPRSRGTNQRANGTSPRQIADAAQALAEEWAKGKRDRRQQRQLAVYRGVISDEQRIAMDHDDAPLEEIPDWAEHLVALAAPPKSWADTL